MEHFCQSIQGWFDFGDFYKKIVEEAKDPARFVEIGAFLGKSTAFMGVEIVNSGKKIRFDVVDHFQGSSEHQTDPVVKDGLLFVRFMQNMTPLLNKLDFHIHTTTSEKASTRFEDKSLDFVFVDGGHEPEWIESDLRFWFPKVKIDGIIAGHDIGYGSVRNATSAFFNDLNSVKLPCVSSCWCYRRIQ